MDENLEVDVKNRDIIIIDDMTPNGGADFKALDLLKKINVEKRMLCVFTHYLMKAL